MNARESGGASPAPRGTLIEDGCLGCLGYIGFQILATSALVLLVLLVLPAVARDGAQDAAGWAMLARVAGVAAGLVGLVVAFRASRAARKAHASRLAQAAPVLVSWALGLVGTAGMMISSVGARPKPPATAPQNLGVIQLDLLAGERGTWDPDPWEGVVELTSDGQRMRQAVSWLHTAPSDINAVRKRAAIGDSLTTAISVPPAEVSPVRLEGAAVDGFTFTRQADGLMVRVTTWDCPGTTLQVNLQTQGRALFVPTIHALAEKTALCLVGAATTSEPDRGVAFRGGRSWRQAATSGSVQEWTTKNELSSAILWTRRSSKVQLTDGISCGNLLETVARDGLPRQGGEPDPARAPVPRTVPTGCTLQLPARVDVDGDLMPFETFWEIRDCGDGNHLLASFFTFETGDKKAEDPSTLWGCGTGSP